MSLPRIAITMGDPAGIGPEICLQLLNHHQESLGDFVPVVFGDAGVLRRVATKLNLPFQVPIISKKDWPVRCRELSAPAVLDLGVITDPAAVVPGKISAMCGEAAYQYVIASIAAGLAGEVDGVSTAPLNKAAMHAAGHHYPGHTEIFAEKMRADRSCMMLTSSELTCSFVTVHVGLHEVPGLINTPRINEVIELTAAAMRRIRNREPKLIVCGLNPHAGENGLFGQGEEERFIIPAVAAARASGLQIEGPLPPDTVFLESRRKVTDAVICMYHDQGHIPLKALAFDSAINTTLGLPVIRTSVDHGTAFDIAWQGQASPNSLFEAVKLAAKLAKK
jgi:4-phospho-D-threonate 3-dehydrogenase / 4-phospho-D-erythronate 3-dehydrogenase